MIKAFGLIKEVIDIGEGYDPGLFLGCKHGPFDAVLKDGSKVRGMIYNSEALLRDCVSLCTELYTGISGHPPKLNKVETPSIPEDVRHTCPSSVPARTGPALQCPWCKFTFSEDQYERLTFSEDQKPSDERWKQTRDNKKDTRTSTNGQQKVALAAACLQHREFPSKSQDCVFRPRLQQLRSILH